MTDTIQSPCLHHFIITMYCHYDQRIQQYQNNPAARQFLERTQAHYIHMHELLVGFNQVVKGLPIYKIKRTTEMPSTDEITIHPSDLKKIVKHLKLIKWNEGPVIIRDTGTKYIIRDKDENHIATLDQSNSNEESFDG